MAKSLQEILKDLNNEKAKGSWKVKLHQAELEKHPVYQLQKSISNAIVELEQKLDEVDTRLTLSDEERQAFLDKAIEQITPYYNTKKMEIEKGINEGKVQSAEDVLLTIRDVQENTNSLLAKFDIDQAETEEDFINNISEITSRKEDDLNIKRAEWKQRLEDAKLNQVKTGVFASGVGRKKIGELDTMKTLDETSLTNRAAEAETQATTKKKYDLERIVLARKAAEEERIRKIGTPDTVNTLQTNASTTLGLQPGQTIGSQAEIAQARADRNITIRNPEDLTSLEEERLKAIESRNQELQNNELAVREQREKSTREKILGDLAAKKNQLANSGAYLLNY